jgi:hypothetical protein
VTNKCELHTCISHGNRGKSIRLFMSGDYEFLSRMYGITGAQGIIHTDALIGYTYKNECSGRHPCLWCTITSESMRVPREDRPQIAPRTLDSLQADLLRFQTTL